MATPTSTYRFTYGVFGLRENIQAGSNTLATYNYTEDGNFNLKSLDYGNGDRVEYEYDTKGRPIKDTYEDGDTVEYLYDNNGDLAKVIDSATGRTTTYYYDFVHQQLKYEVVGEDHFHSVSYEYDKTDDLLDKQTEVINGTTTTTTYTYDTDNRVETVTVNGVTVIYSYNNYGNISQKVTKIGTNTYKTETFTYTSANGGYSSQVATHRIVSGSMDTTYSYTYDGNGNITSVSDGSTTTRYTYDSANQLLREDNENAYYTKTWTYDNAGNITSRKEYLYTTTDEQEDFFLLKADTYGYPTVPVLEEGTQNPVWGDLLTEYNGNDFDYDDIGNLTYDGEWDYTWERGRQLSRISRGAYGWSFEYNADGMRTKRTDGTTTYEYTYNGSQLTQMKVGNNIYRFTYDAGGTPLTFSKNGVVYYYLTNLQGDVIEILDSDGNTVGAYTYDAWGVCSRIIADPIESENPLRYRGYVYDQETGLYYLQSRYYDPQLCRFLNADSFTSTGQSFVGNNMFAYCGNNPIYTFDPQGTYCCTVKENKTACAGWVSDTPSFWGGLVACLFSVSVAKPVVNTVSTDIQDETTVVTNVVSPTSITIYYPADITGNISTKKEWKVYPLPMNFCTAVAWVYTTAASKRYGKNANWGIYTPKQEDAYALANILGGAVNCPVSHLDNLGEHPHYHVAGMNLFGYYKHFHIWYGSENGG